MKRVGLLLIVLISGVAQLYGQKYPERSYIRSGNKCYEKGDFNGSEIRYRRALEKAPQSFDAAYNVGNALYKQGNWAEAADTYSKIAADSTLEGGKDKLAPTLYNAGNALVQAKEYEKAIEAYKQSLRINPSDQEAKFNLAYAKKKLEDQKNKEDKNKDQNKDQDKNNDQNQDKNDPNQDQNKQDKQDKDQNKPDKNQQDQDKQNQQGGMNKEEADRMLEAAQMSEDKARDKQNAQKATAVGKSGKNW